MKGIVGFTKHLFGAMLKGFFFTGLIVGIVCAGVLYATEPGHHMTMDVSATFGIVLTGLAAVLGAAVALIYHLAHLDGIHHGIQRFSDARATDRQRGHA